MIGCGRTSGAQPVVREVRCKTILGESGICDYCVNCYTGCTHACAYCYARFMCRFQHHDQPWGSFVDAKVNAPEVLARQLAQGRLLSAGSVFISSVCDPYQPAEASFGLTRRCLTLLLERGFQVHLQTKGDLVRRDFDLLAGRTNAVLCMTITTTDDDLARQIEPRASSATARIEALRQAGREGIRTRAFVGPLLPTLTDTPESTGAVFSALVELGLEAVYVDRLNLRWGVWPAMKQTLERIAPDAIPATRAVLFDASQGRAYEQALRRRVRDAARDAGLTAPLTMAL